MKFFISLSLFLSLNVSASIIKIDFDGYVQGQDELNILGINDTFQNQYASGTVTINTDKLPENTGVYNENHAGFYHSGNYETDDSSWLTISFNINGITLDENLIFNDKSSMADLFDTSDSAIAENLILSQSSEYRSPGADYLSGEFKYIGSTFRLSTFDGNDLITGAYFPETLPTYDYFNIGFIRQHWQGDGSMVGVQQYSNFNFTSLSNLTYAVKVPEPSSLAIFFIGFAGIIYKKKSSNSKIKI